MKTTLTLILASALVLALLTPCAAQDDVASPPAIYLPAGGKVVTEINLSDEDVLGIIKESIPALADVAKELLPLKMGASPEAAEAIVNAIDVTGLMDAISGINNVRILIAKYPPRISPERFLKEFNMGVAKAGRFNRIMTDFGFSGGAAGLYALPDNAGCIGVCLRSRPAHGLRGTHSRRARRAEADQVGRQRGQDDWRPVSVHHGGSARRSDRGSA